MTSSATLAIFLVVVDLVALVAAVVIQLRMTFLKKSEEDFLDSCREYCMVNVVRRLRLDTSQPSDLGSSADG